MEWQRPGWNSIDPQHFISEKNGFSVSNSRFNCLSDWYKVEVYQRKCYEY